jgi:hypothetical protein
MAELFALSLKIHDLIMLSSLTQRLQTMELRIFHAPYSKNGILYSFDQVSGSAKGVD